MRKFVALMLLLLVAFVVVNRRRLFLRDPLAKVSRGGVAVSAMTVMINYPNDVLLDDTSVAGQRRIYLLQHWNQQLETPTAALRCVDALACLTDADQATGERITPARKGAQGVAPTVTMTNRQVTFVDENGAPVTVTLR